MLVKFLSTDFTGFKLQFLLADQFAVLKQMTDWVNVRNGVCLYC